MKNCKLSVKSHLVLQDHDIRTITVSKHLYSWSSSTYRQNSQPFLSEKHVLASNAYENLY